MLSIGVVKSGSAVYHYFIDKDNYLEKSLEGWFNFSVGTKWVLLLLILLEYY